MPTKMFNNWAAINGMISFIKENNKTAMLIKINVAEPTANPKM